MLSASYIYRCSVALHNADLYVVYGDVGETGMPSEEDVAVAAINEKIPPKMEQLEAKLEERVSDYLVGDNLRF